MVSVDYALSSIGNEEDVKLRILDGLSVEHQHQIEALINVVRPLYSNRVLETGENMFHHVLGAALNLAQFDYDFFIRAASLLYQLSPEQKLEKEIDDIIHPDIKELAQKVARIHRLRPVARELLKPLTLEEKPKTLSVHRLKRLDNTVLHKILLASAEDFRVILVRLSSRTQTMRYLAKQDNSSARYGFAVETMELYAPLANRLGLWQFKWELEDYSFRILEPAIYRKIASQINEKRTERERFINNAVSELEEKLKAAQIPCEITGRPKHIYSIYKKMCRKGIDLDHVEGLYDIRAVRVLVNTIEDCYKTLDIVHTYQTPIAEEFDDYIHHPKENGYQSIHTAVMCPDGRSLEIQIRTFMMHEHAEQGVAAHWCYKEGVAPKNQDNRIHLLRQLLRWQDELLQQKTGDEETSVELSEALKLAGFDQIIYVVTPQGDVVDLPKGATPVDFAYQLHTNLGHRCRGAKVDGNIVPLNYALQTLQQVEILASKQEAGPSRDWLNPELGFLHTNHAKSKVRQWFNKQAQQRNLLQGRAIVYREMQREGATGINLETLAQKLGFDSADDLFLAVRRPEFGIRSLQIAIRQAVLAKDSPEQPAEDFTLPSPQAKPASALKQLTAQESDVFIVGVGNLMSRLAKCCRPSPPDPIMAFVVQGKGVSIHHKNCKSFANIRKRHPERVLEAHWKKQDLFIIDAEIEADDRKGIVRDVVDCISKLQINIVGINTNKQPQNQQTLLQTSLEVSDMRAFDQAVSALLKIEGIKSVKRV